MNLISKILQKLSKKETVIEAPVFEKTCLSKVKTGSTILNDNLSLSPEGSKFRIRDFEKPKTLIVVEKHLETRKRRWQNQEVFVKLQDESGNRYNLRASLDSKLQVQKKGQN